MTRETILHVNKYMFYYGKLSAFPCTVYIYDCNSRLPGDAYFKILIASFLI